MALQSVSSTNQALTLIHSSSDWLVARRFQILFLLLLLQVVTFCLQGIWVEDFWEHSAAVGELIRHPFNPGHPQLDVSAAHTFLNPYTFVVAQFARLFQLDAISALSIFGVINFCLFCYGLHAFISSLQIRNRTSSLQSRNVDNNALTFYALLLILFLWGGKPWPYSGFFNYDIFFWNLAYPSTFIGGLSLLGLAFNARHQFERNYLYLAVLIALTTTALLTHPLTAQFLLIGFFAQIFTTQPTPGGQQITRSVQFIALSRIAIIFVASLAIATRWPFYPILELFQGASKVYDISNGDMYFHLLTRTWPFMVLAPLFLWMLLKPALRPLLIIFVVTATIYGLGYVTERYSFGRIVSYTIIVIQIACAVAVFQFERWLQGSAPRIARFGQIATLLLLLFWASHWAPSSISRLLTAGNSVWLDRTVSNQIIYKDYLFLPSHIAPQAVVFADIETSWFIPSFEAKVVAADHPLAFVKDAEQRREDVIKFFEQQTTAQERTALLQKYQAKYLLLNKQLNTAWAQIYSHFSNITPNAVLFENEKFVLIKI
ncbi:hypothetical protein MCERE10_03822 [Burkholderiaceae bacterium]